MIINSRNRYPHALIEMFNLPDEDIKEYEKVSLKGEESLADAVIKDCQAKGLRLIAREEEKNGTVA